ncbi:MAG TPA: hypothetical protein VK550_10090 [Polyangiaceae bacterium]|nr:hypothetical protein [Polyangiaceae bacterium]
MIRGIRLFAIAGAAVLSACGDRAPEWDAAAQEFSLGQLRDAAVLVDRVLNRGLVITASADEKLDFKAVRLGKGIVSTTTSADRERTFVLSQGDPVRLRPSDEGPALSVLEAGHAAQVKRYELPDALTSLALDPAGRYAVVYAGNSAGGTFIKNPNELIIVDLAAPPSQDNPGRRNLPSNIGGSPQRLTFTDPLHLPAGDRRLLVVETDRDVMLLDLEHPDRPEVSLPVKDPRTDSRALSPAGIAVDPGEAGSIRRFPALAVRTNADDNVIIYTLGPSDNAPPENDFIPTPNAAVVGGVPSDIAFVNTNQGPRLAVMVPSSTTATGFLIKVDDNQTLTAKFATTYQRISPVAGFASDRTGVGDQLMLWSTDGRTNSIAFWDLDKVPNIPFGSIDTLKSIETLNLNGTVASVVSLPERNLKIVETSTSALYVLDPEQHLTNALSTTGRVMLRYSREGDRAWAFALSQKALAQIALVGAHIVAVDVDRPVSDVVEIERSDGGRALLALHTLHAPIASLDDTSAWYPGPTVGVTVFDALAPDAAVSRRYAAVLLEGLAP